MPRRGLLLTFDERRCQEIRNRLPICPAILQARKPDCFKYNLPDTSIGNRADVMQRREGDTTPSLRVEKIDQRASGVGSIEDIVAACAPKERDCTKLVHGPTDHDGVRLHLDRK